MENIVDNHLIPEFGDLYVDQMRPVEIKTWQGKVAAKIRTGKMAPATANTIIGVLRQITDEAIGDFDIRDPMRGVDPFDTREHNTYTEEEPNSLPPDAVPTFPGKMLEMHPQHYGFTFLGFTTGLRPSSLRPLRREGPHADLRWKESLPLVRRSQTIGDEVMEPPKTDQHQRLLLPRELLDVLRCHVDEQLLHAQMRLSDLLFPSVRGRFSREVLP